MARATPRATGNTTLTSTTARVMAQTNSIATGKAAALVGAMARPSA